MVIGSHKLPNLSLGITESREKVFFDVVIGWV